MKRFIALVKETFKQWSADKASRLAASLSFYAMLSMAPLLMLSITMAGAVLGGDRAQQSVLRQAEGMVGAQSAKALEGMVNNALLPNMQSWTGLLGVATLIWGASAVFNQLHEAMNQIWNVEIKPGLGYKTVFKRRLISFLLVAIAGCMLLASLIFSALSATLGTYFTKLLPGGEPLWQEVNMIVSLSVMTLLFALAYRLIPDVYVAWRDVWLGAAVTALLFVVGNQMLTLYLGYLNFSSIYGAAGSLVALLLWVYYSAQIFFFGAEFTQVYATQYGQGVIPAANARLGSKRVDAEPQRPVVGPGAFP